MTLSKSDGDPSQLPEVEEEVVDANGNVDYLGEAEEEVVKAWFMKIASYLVYEGDWYKPAYKQQFTLTRLPEHYKLYTHYKGNKHNPRKDTYLYGSATARCQCFRSAEEFALHAKWLAFGCPRKKSGKADCGCRYCSNRRQGEISAELKASVGDLFRNSAATPAAAPRTLQLAARTSGRRPRDDGPIRAKDYTNLNVNGKVGEWVENMSYSRPKK